MRPFYQIWVSWACMYCIAFHRSHLYITNPGSVSHFSKTWVSFQTTTYKSKDTKYFDILLLLTCEEVLHAPTVQIWALNSTILTPNYLLIVCHSSITIGHSTLFQNSRLLCLRNNRIWENYRHFWKSFLWPIRNGGIAVYQKVVWG